MVKNDKKCYDTDCPSNRTEHIVPKKLMGWAAIALAVWWIYKQPKGAAGAVGGAFSALGDAGTSAITFLTTLFS